MVASDGAIKVESSKGPWAVSAACSAQGPRPQNEDVHVMICDGLPEGPAPNIKAAGLPGLFDDLPELVSGPSLPAVEKVQCTDSLFAVFDGHRGISAARACAERIPTEIREDPPVSKGAPSLSSRGISARLPGVRCSWSRHARSKAGRRQALSLGSQCGTRLMELLGPRPQNALSQKLFSGRGHLPCPHLSMFQV